MGGAVTRSGVGSRKHCWSCSTGDGISDLAYMLARNVSDEGKLLLTSSGPRVLRLSMKPEEDLWMVTLVALDAVARSGMMSVMVRMDTSVER